MVLDRFAWLLRSIQVTAQRPLQFPIPPHQFEETDGVAHGMDAADFVGVDGGDGDGFDAKTFATGDEEHLGFVIETVGAAEQFRDEMPM